MDSHYHIFENIEIWQKFHGCYFWSRTQIDMPARLIIRLLFGFASASVFLNQSTNSETVMLSKHKDCSGKNGI